MRISAAFFFSSIVAYAVTINIPQTGASSVYDGLIAAQAEANGVPVSLIHHVIMRESRYNPRAVSGGNYGLMQIRLGTARAMGYRGSARGPARSSNQFDVCGSILGRCLSCRSRQRKPRSGAICARLLWGGEEARFLAIRFFSIIHNDVLTREQPDLVPSAASDGMSGDRGIDCWREAAALLLTSRQRAALEPGFTTTNDRSGGKRAAPRRIAGST
jgi:hypothetical protein